MSYIKLTFILILWVIQRHSLAAAKAAKKEQKMK